jgi:hypothetical protein
LQGLGGRLLLPEATRRCTKLSILCPLVSVNNRFPPNGNDSTPLSFNTSILGPTSISLAKPFACTHFTPSVQNLKNVFGWQVNEGKERQKQKRV